jgi:importin subunit beta-1
MELLMNLSMNKDSRDHEKLGALKAIGYSAEELDPDATPGVSDLVLTSIVNNLNSNIFEIKMTACTAMRSSLHFCKKSFEVDDEKDVLIKTILSTIQCGNVEVGVEAFGILVDIVGLYYPNISSHIEEIFGVTLGAIQEADEEIAKMAIEFWNSVCEEEINFKEKKINYNAYTAPAVKVLVPILFTTITKQEPDYDPDDQNLPVSASICLNYFAKAVGSYIVDTLLPIVEQNINSTNWNEQDAAILALGAILFVPSENIETLVKQAIPILLGVLQNSPVDVVRDTALWTVGQIFHLHPHLVADSAKNIIELMGVKTVEEVPRVSSQACWVIHAIIESYGSDPQNPVYEYFGDLIDCLLKTAEREDAGEFMLRINAYETLNGLLQHAQEPHVEILSRLYESVCIELQSSINSMGDSDALAEKQEMLCAMITVLAPNIADNIISTHSPLMEVLCNLLRSKNGHKVSSEVFLTITIVAQIVGGDFIDHVPVTMDLILEGIRDIQNQKTCQYATDLLSDMVSLLGTGFNDYCEVILDALFANLRNPELHRSVKPYIYETFSEIALSLGDPFQKYLPPILLVLTETANDLASLNENELDEETMEYVDALRKGLFSALTGVLTEIRNSSDKESLEHLYTNSQAILMLVERTFMTEQSSYDTFYAAIGLVGDLLLKVGKRVNNYITEGIVNSIQRCCSSPALNVKEEALRVESIFRKMDVYSK